MRRRGQRGFTLIELMVSLVISSLVVIMVLTIFARLSSSLREKKHVTNLHHVLSAVRRTLAHDAQHAGYQLAQGFTVAADGVGVGAMKHAPIRIRNRADGPDEIAFYYADPAKAALVTTSGIATTIGVDDPGAFAVGDLVVLSTVDTSTLSPIAPTTDAKVATYRACVLVIATIAGSQVMFEQSGHWGTSTSAHCADTRANVTMMFGFVAHAWRVDLSGPEGILQLDARGGLDPAPTYLDQAVGVADLQLATYVHDGDGTDTADPDLDGDRDWYSGAQQDVLTSDVLVTDDFVAPLVLGVSIVVRSTGNLEGATTAATPQLLDPASVDHNPLGDRDAIVLPAASRRVYRHASFRIDLRNLGVGR